MKVLSDARVLVSGAGTETLLCPPQRTAVSIPQAQLPPDRRQHLAERCCRFAILNPTAFVVVKMHNTLETGNLNPLGFGVLKTLETGMRDSLETGVGHASPV
jgi:hypothetical protein